MTKTRSRAKKKKEDDRGFPVMPPSGGRGGGNPVGPDGQMEGREENKAGESARHRQDGVSTCIGGRNNDDDEAVATRRLERKREMKAGQSRRKRARERLEMEVLRERSSLLSGKNLSLYHKNKKLEALLHRANKIVREHQDGSTEKSPSEGMATSLSPARPPENNGPASATVAAFFPPPAPAEESRLPARPDGGTGALVPGPSCGGGVVGASADAGHFLATSPLRATTTTTTEDRKMLPAASASASTLSFAAGNDPFDRTTQATAHDGTGRPLNAIPSATGGSSSQLVPRNTECLREQQMATGCQQREQARVPHQQQQQPTSRGPARTDSTVNAASGQDLGSLVTQILQQQQQQGQRQQQPLPNQELGVQTQENAAAQTLAHAGIDSGRDKGMIISQILQFLRQHWQPRQNQNQTRTGPLQSRINVAATALPAVVDAAAAAGENDCGIVVARQAQQPQQQPQQQWMQSQVGVHAQARDKTFATPHDSPDKGEIIAQILQQQQRQGRVQSQGSAVVDGDDGLESIVARILQQQQQEQERRRESSEPRTVRHAVNDSRGAFDAVTLGVGSPRIDLDEMIRRLQSQLNALIILRGLQSHGNQSRS